MKLIRFGDPGKENPGIETSEGIRLDCSAFGEDWNENFFGSNGIDRLASWLAKNSLGCPAIDSSIRLGAPLCRPSKIICIGLNYASHAAESGMEIPKEPILFMKATSSICGPFDNIMIPKDSSKTDWEVELGVVIGKKATYVKEAEAMDYVAGYLLHNDVSERDYQLNRGGQWVKGKSFDHFSPLGPYLVLKKDIPDPHDLNIWLKVNGELFQNGHTSDLIYKIPELISYISKFMTLLPGDIISTGTPSGVGLGFKPPIYLKDGDVVTLGIEKMGESRQQAVPWKM